MGAQEAATIGGEPVAWEAAGTEHDWIGLEATRANSAKAPPGGGVRISVSEP
jgi:hypothetical protein